MAVRIKWRRGVWAEVRTLPGVMDELNRHAERIAADAGDGFGARPAAATGGRVRGRASVGTDTWAAMARQARDHILERSI